MILMGRNLDGGGTNNGGLEGSITTCFPIIGNMIWQRLHHLFHTLQTTNTNEA
jgi:hypothetical protein